MTGPQSELEGADGAAGCWARLKSNRGSNPEDDLILIELTYCIGFSIGLFVKTTYLTHICLNMVQKINRIETKEL